MKTFRKLKSTAGESLIEILAAILVFAMASVVMYTLVSAAGKLNAAAKSAYVKNQDNLIAIQTASEDVHNGEATLTFSLNGIVIDEVDVEIYGEANDGVFAYFMKKGKRADDGED